MPGIGRQMEKWGGKDLEKGKIIQPKVLKNVQPVAGEMAKGWTICITCKSPGLTTNIT